jgi:hypothetical protein
MSIITGFIVRPLKFVMAVLDGSQPGRIELHLWLWVCAALLPAGCSVATPPPTAVTAPAPPPAFVFAPAAEALPALVAAEREAARRGDVPLLAQLWAEDALIIDGRGTTDLADDYRWQGRAAILDRYRLAVFPSPPPPLDNPALPEAVITGDGTAATLIVDGDRWRFAHRAERWWLLELAYNLGP